MTLAGDTRALARPGQFVQVQVPGFYLRRPLSVYDWQAAENGWLVLVYKALGHGTEALAQVNWRDPGMDDLSRLFGCLLFGGSAKVPFGAKTGKIPTKAMATGPCAPFMDDLDALMERVELARPQALAPSKAVYVGSAPVNSATCSAYARSSFAAPGKVEMKDRCQLGARRRPAV